MYSEYDVLSYIEEENVKFIRLSFCDVTGREKNTTIMPGELKRAFTDGISFDASAIAGFGNVTHSDLFLFPDPSTPALSLNRQSIMQKSIYIISSSEHNIYSIFSKPTNRGKEPLFPLTMPDIWISTPATNANPSGGKSASPFRIWEFTPKAPTMRRVPGRMKSTSAIPNR